MQSSQKTDYQIYIQRKKRLIISSIIICLMILVTAGYIGICKLLQDAESRKEYDQIRQDATIQADDAEEIPLYVDFDALWKINPDIVGWIYIPCIQTSYPILQAADNEYYLHRTVDRKDRYAGSIFIDMDNASDFTDPNTIVYGHNMKDGSMFGRLWHIPINHVADDDPYFWIFTPEKIYKYKIFSAYETKADQKTYNLFRFRNTEFRNWCYEMRSWSYIDYGEYPFTKESRIVTLSTCSGTSKIDRTVVQGVQYKEFDFATAKRQYEQKSQQATRP